MNALWFLSLVISLTCALLATLLQQWARRYLKITQSRYTPHKRARIRAFFSEGIAKCLLPWVVDALPTLLHISLFLFFAGLAVFLCNVNLTIFKLVLSWVGLCAALYGCITCMPIFRHDSPYYTPLSLPAWHIVTGILFFCYRFLRWFNWSVRHHGHAYLRFCDLEERCRESLVRGMQKTAEETALKSPSEIDARAFMWTLDCLDEDHELERFFSGLPGFRSSNVVDDPLLSLTREDQIKLYGILHGLLDRTFLSDFLPAPVKDRRAMICAKAADLEPMPNACNILITILTGLQHIGPVAIATAKLLRSWGDEIGGGNSSAQLHIFWTIASSQPRDSSWYSLASNELGLPETSLRDYAVHGDSLSLVICIHFVRLQFTHFMEPGWLWASFELVLNAASKFNVQDTSPQLKDEFCALWNQIVNVVQGSDDEDMACYILRPIRNVYLALHQDTDSAPTRFSASTDDRDIILLNTSSYPVCKVPDHRSNSALHIHNENASMTLAHAVPHDHNNTASVTSPANPDPPSSSTHAPLPVDETLIDALPLNSQISIPGSKQHIGRMTTESRRIPPTLPSLVTTYATHLSATEPSTSGPPPKPDALASPPDGIAVGLTILSCAPSDDLNVQSSPSPTQVHGVMPPTGLLLF